MSGLATEFAPAGLTPEETIALNQRMAQRNAELANTVASVPATLIAPDRRLPSAVNWIPGTGLVEGLAGTAGAILDAGATLGNAGLSALGFKTRLPNAPAFLTGAGEHFGKTQSDIQDVIAANTPLAKPDPTDPEGRLIQTVGSVLGGAIPVVPAGIARAVTNLVPYGTKTLANFLLPSTEGAAANIPIAGAVAGEQGAAEVFNQPPGQAKPTAAAAAAPDDAQDIGLQDAVQPVQIAENRKAGTASDVGITSYLNPQAATPTLGGATDLGITGALTGDKGPLVPSPDTGYSGMTVAQAGWTIAGIITAIAAARYTHGTSRVITDIERTARFNDPEYAAKASDYNNARIARGGSEIASERVDPPLPEQNRFRQATNWANNEFLNSNAQMQDAIRMTAEPSVAEALAYEYGNVHSDATFKIKLGQFLDTGRDALTGIRIPSPIKLFRDIQRLSKDEQDTLNNGLHALDEKDNRTNNLNDFQAANPGATPAIEDIRHNFKNQSNEQLDAVIARMTSDAKLNEIADRFFRIPTGMVDIGVGHGFFPQAEAASLKATHPHHVAEAGPTGEILHPFGRRDRTLFTGTDQVNTMAWHNLAQHVEELYRQFELNRSNRDLRESFMEAQRTQPNAAQFMYDVPAPRNTTSTYYSGGTAREPIVTIRTSQGPVYTRIDHPDIMNAFTGDSLQKRNIVMGALALPRRVFQYFTTGVGSLATGRIGPIFNTAYTTLTAPINAPKGTYGGLLDRALQRNLPTSVSNVLSPVARGLDVVATQPGTVGYAYGRGLFDRTAGRLGTILDPTERNIINDTFRAYLAPAQVDKMARDLRQYYENTRTFRMQSELGLGGMGTSVKTDLPSLQILSNKRASLVSASMVPKLFMNDGMFGEVKPFVFQLNRSVQEAMGHLSDAGNEAYARLNWDNPNVSTSRLAYEARNLVGDPGNQPRNPLVAGLLGAVPYGNVSVQGVARLGRSFGDRPIGTPVTIGTGLGTLALIELLTHMRSNAHMSYYNNAVSSQQQAANVILATNDDPTKPMMIPVPQELRAAKVLVTALVSNALNSIAVQHDPDTYKNIWNTLVDFFGSHITNKAVDSTIHGAVDAFDFINPPRWMGHEDWNGVIHGKGLFDSYRSPIYSQELNLPNQVQDGWWDGKNGKIFRDIIGNVFGLAGIVAEDVNNMSRYAKQTGSWVEGLGMTGHDWLQGFKDKNPLFNMLWENPVRLSMQPPIEEMMQRKLDAIKAVTGSRTGELGEGETKYGRFAQPVPTSQTPRLPVDPTVRAMYNIVGAYKSRMGWREQEIAEIKKQMGAVQIQGMDPDTRRKWMNDRTRDVADKYRVLHGMVSDLEYALSQQAGRPINVEDLDFTKGMEQFQ